MFYPGQVVISSDHDEFYIILSIGEDEYEVFDGKSVSQKKETDISHLLIDDEGPSYFREIYKGSVVKNRPYGRLSAKSKKNRSIFSKEIKIASSLYNDDKIIPRV